MASEKILIVDDEPNILDVCQIILDSRYQVKSTTSGLEAIELVKREHFDLLLTDVKMTEIDGLAVVNSIRQINPNIICITMTGFGTLDMAIEALRVGTDDFLVKPFSPNTLRLTVNRALEKERLRRENIRLKSLLSLFEFNKLLMSTVDPNRLLEYILDLTVQETQANEVVLYVYVSEKLEALLSHDLMPSTRLSYFQDKADHLFQIFRHKRSPLILNFDPADQATLTPDEIQVKALFVRLQPASVIMTPLQGKDTLHGVLIATKENQPFTPSEYSFLSVMAGQATTAYDNALLFGDLQQAYDKLLTLDHMKSEFINRAAHELRTPLAILMGYVGLLETTEDDETRQHLAAILRSSIRLRSVIDDLINMRHIDVGELSLEIVELDLQNLIEQCVQDFAFLADEKDIQLQMMWNQPLPLVQTDEEKVGLVVTNLLSNAIKFTPNWGQITITGSRQEEAVEIAIRDSGVGITEAEIEKIFESFYQVESAMTRQHEGLGLGLSIARGVIEYLGGDFRVESQPNQGSIFTFSLPINGP